MTQPPTLEVRNVRFTIDRDLPHPWNGDGRAITLFFDNLSIFFPAGERFFIEAVKAHAHLVGDPKLAADLRAFCAQEGIHSREHTQYNEHLRRRGYPIDALEGRVMKLLTRARRRLPVRRRLAATAALEHFTALMGDFVLRDPRILERAHPTMAALWRWHAAEENEHKAVAFDVYRAANGPYFERVSAMAVSTVIFWTKVIEHQVRLMHAEGILTSPSEWSSLLRWMFVDPGWMWHLARQYFAYFRPDFHPWDLNNADLVERWRATYSHDVTAGA